MSETKQISGKKRKAAIKWKLGSLVQQHFFKIVYTCVCVLSVSFFLSFLQFFVAHFDLPKCLLLEGTCGKIKALLIHDHTEDLSIHCCHCEKNLRVFTESRCVFQAVGASRHSAGVHAQ